MAKRRLAMFLSLILVIITIFSACGGNTGGSKDEKVLTVGTYMNITTLLPWKSTTDGDYYVLNQIYHKLIEMDNNSVFRPVLADTWECAADGKTWTFHLNKNIYWHTGNDLFKKEKVQVTAEDVKYTLEFHMNPDNATSRYSDISGTVDKITVIDPQTIEIVTKDIDVLFEYKMYQILIIPKKAIDEGWDLNAYPVGSNAYKFEKHEIDTEVVLVKNEDYYIKPGLDKIIYRIIPDNNVCAIALQNREVDVAVSVAAEDIDNIAPLDYVELRSSGVGSTRWLGINVQHELFQDVQVRRALTMMVDMDKAVEALFQSNSGINLADRGYAPIPLERPGGDQVDRYKAQHPGYDPAGGRAILESLGWAKNANGIYEKNGKPFSFILQVGNNDPIRENLSVIVSTQMKENGVDCTARTAEWGTHLTDLDNGNCPMYIVGGYSSLDGPMKIMHSDPTVFSPNPGYSNPNVDALLEEAWRTVDSDARAELLTQAAEQFVYDCVFMTAYFQYFQTGVNLRVTDFEQPSVYLNLCTSWRNVSVTNE